MYVCIPHVSGTLQGIRSLEARITDSCELPCSSGNQTQVLWKSSLCSYPPIQLTIPTFMFFSELEKKCVIKGLVLFCSIPYTRLARESVSPGTLLLISLLRSHQSLLVPFQSLLGWTRKVKHLEVDCFPAATMAVTMAFHLFSLERQDVERQVEMMCSEERN